MPQTLPNIPLSRSALLGVLTTIQNGPTFADQDIMSFAGMCSTVEVSEHVMACFGRLTAAEKGRALADLQSRLAPVPAYRPAMVPQPYQQQQAQAGAPVWIQTNEVRSDLTGPRGIVLGSVERKAGQWNADKVPAHARSRTTRTMLGAYPTEAEARTAVERAVGGPQPPAPRSAAATAWGARMDEKHPRSAPRPPREDSPAMKAALAIAADAGRRYGEAQLAVRAKHDITAAPALASRYGRAA